MNKKAYLAPTMEATEIETQTMLASSGNAVHISNETTDHDASMSNEHRRTWGDLWN